MVAYSKQLVVFSLNGTLCLNDQAIDSEMASLLSKLLERKKVAIISGANFPSFQAQVLNIMPPGEQNYDNFFLLPTSGTRLFAWRGSWNEQYSEHLSPQQKEKIMSACNAAMRQLSDLKVITGSIFDDRGSQISFCPIGLQTPADTKKAWDPNRAKRYNLVSILQTRLPEFELRVSGDASVDITRKGLNKAFGIRRLEEYLKIGPDAIIFVGDSLYPGGNDFPAKATGADCITVSGPEETKKVIREWIA